MSNKKPVAVVWFDNNYCLFHIKYTTSLQLFTIIVNSGYVAMGKKRQKMFFFPESLPVKKLVADLR
jgi:hypothetical protein